MSDAQNDLVFLESITRARTGQEDEPLIYQPITNLLEHFSRIPPGSSNPNPSFLEVIPINPPTLLLCLFNHLHCVHLHINH